MEKNINFVAVMRSESFLWIGYGETEDEAKRMILQKWQKELDDEEITLEEMERFYDFDVQVCSEGNGFCIEI